MGMVIGQYLAYTQPPFRDNSSTHHRLWCTFTTKICSKTASVWRKYRFSRGGIALLGISAETDVTLLGDIAAIIGAVAVVGYLVAGRKLRQWMPLFVYTVQLLV